MKVSPLIACTITDANTASLDGTYRFEVQISKTGAKVVQLNRQALEILETLERDPENPFVIQGLKPRSHLSDLNGPWRRIRKAAGIEDARLHDLRHSYASVGAAAGLSLPMIGNLLGHRQPATTARYAHLTAAPVRQAAETIGDNLAAVFDA